MLTMFLEEKMAGDTLCEKRRVFAEGSRLETGVRGLAVWSEQVAKVSTAEKVSTQGLKQL